MKTTLRERWQEVIEETERACLQGFPDTFKIPVSDVQAYKQFGNSVCVPVIRAIAQNLKPFLLTEDPVYHAPPPHHHQKEQRERVLLDL